MQGLMRGLHDWLFLYVSYFYAGYNQNSSAILATYDYFNGVRG